MEVVKPVQERALAERGTLWAHAADEFYCNAYGDALLEHLPPASCYGEFEMFEDGVGIVRSFADDWQRAVELGADAACEQVLRESNVAVRLVFGYATRGFAARLLGESAVAGLVRPLFVKNDFFGGNVDVTGLLCGCDIVRAIRDDALREGPLDEPASLEDADSPRALFCIPRVVFNDDGVTLDDMMLADIEKAAGAHVAVVSCNGSEFLPEIARLAADMRAKSFEG